MTEKPRMEDCPVQGGLTIINVAPIAPVIAEQIAAPVASQAAPTKAAAKKELNDVG